MQNPANLRVTAQALEVARLTYAATASFPDGERFGLVSQMRRSAVSIGSNIAEGCGRDTNASLRTFLHYALGSVSELQFQLTLARSLEVGDDVSSGKLDEALSAMRGMLTKLIGRMRPRPSKNSEPAASPRRP